MHVVEIEVGDRFHFHCPVTGVLVSGPEHFGPSPATAFLLGPEAEDFDHLAADLAPLWDEVRRAADRPGTTPGRLLSEFCRLLDGRRHLVLFTLAPAAGARGARNSTIHVCIDFSAATRDEDPDDASACRPPAEVPLPRHLPLESLDTLLADADALWGGFPHTPPSACRAFGEQAVARVDGLLTGAADGGAESPRARLARGARLVIPVHAGDPASGAVLIDGHRCVFAAPDATDGHSRADRSGPDGHPPGPRDTFAIGLGLADDRLTVEAVKITAGGDAGPAVSAAEFPERLRRRIAAYLARLF